MVNLKIKVKISTVCPKSGLHIALPDLSVNANWQKMSNGLDGYFDDSWVVAFH